jgi:hypothetical protein
MIIRARSYNNDHDQDLKIQHSKYQGNKYQESVKWT